MSTTDAPPPPPPTAPPGQFTAPYAAFPPTAYQPPVPHDAKPPLSVPSVIAFVLALLTVVGYLAVKTFVPVVNGPAFDRSYDTVATVFGVLGLLSIVPIVVTIVLAHLGVRKKLVGHRGRVLAIAALVLGYFMLALFANRLIVSLIAIAVNSHGPSFLQDNFYWA